MYRRAKSDIVTLSGFVAEYFEDRKSDLELYNILEPIFWSRHGRIQGA